jgi:flagellar motility protein MotE (MotC chaperone)
MRVPVRAHPPKNIFLVLLTLIALVSCFTPSNAQKKHNGNSGSNNKGFGKTASEDKKKTAAVIAAKSEQRYLEPHGLELRSNDDDALEERGVRTLKHRPAGDVLLEIPLEDTITVDRIRSRLASCPRDDENSNNDEEDALALGLLRLRDEASDPYVANVLPKKHFNVWTLPVDLWKNVSVVLPRCYAETFDATRQRVLQFATRVAEQAASNPDDMFTVDDALWAFSMVRSRSLAVPELDNDNDNTSGDRVPLALIPGLDLLNHAFGSGTQLQLFVDDSDGQELQSAKWVVTSSDPIEAGDEVFLSYGDDKDNWKLLLTYGFALPDNPNAVVFWSWRDLLDAAQTVRPDTFSDRVCRQLLRHPQLEAYTVVSEQRATFSYDVSTDAPRESLANGLAMLNSLAAQLGKPEPDAASLSNQVLGALLRRRIEELKDGQSRLNDRRAEIDNDENYSEWRPFFDSLRVALESEQRQLQTTQRAQ